MKGFTFIELLVSMFIILLLVGLSFPFYLSVNKQLTMDRAATKLAQDIRRAIEMTMSAQEFNNQYPKGGYGIYFPGTGHSSDKYYLFADENESRSYDLGELVEEIKMGRGIKIRKMSLPLPPLGILFSSVTFKPPEPIIYFNKSDGGDFLAPGGEIPLRIYDSNGNYYRVIINKVGLVYIR